jgi:asparagine synthase (glutamine-hydrolysing)
MCGICGVVSADEQRDLSQLSRRMTAALVHRGPDATGTLEVPGIGLGMRRLSIIDRATGQQPVFNEDASVAVIFNGEIYNFQHLRHELEKSGHQFRTRCDTEAIVHAYEEWGDACLNRLRGMFALAVFDRRLSVAGRRQSGRRILLARDRLGIKPLYYARVDGLLLFASEVRALLTSGVVPRELSQAGLESYLLFGSVSEPETLVDGVRSLPPGHALVVDGGPALNGCTPSPYWQLEARNTATSAVPRTEAARALRALLEDSIRVHLISDEPLGVFLSGGVDSTIVATLASRARSGVRCYTIRFDEREFDESEAARRTATRLGVEHCELQVGAAEMLGSMDAAVGALDQPSVDGINTYCVSGAVRRAGAKVALSGLGGDELFGGYRTFRWIPRLCRLSAVARWTPGGLRRPSARAMSRAGHWMGRPEDTERLAALWRDPDALPHPFFFARTVFGPEDVNRLVVPSVATNEREPWRSWIEDTAGIANDMDSFGAVSYLELRSYMVNTLLRDADAMSMAHSLELRVPLLDHPVVEFVANQPSALKQHGRAYKPLLVDALGDLLPSEVADRPKQGFTFPWSQWIRGPLAPRVGSQLEHLAPALSGRLHRHAVAEAWTGFRDRRVSWLRPWSLYVLNEWAHRHL